MLKKIKDCTFSTCVKAVINYKVKEYGKMLNFKLDSKNKTIELELMLDGEKDPLTVKVDNYKLSHKDDKHYLVVKDITTSRKWINVIAEQYLHGQKFEIPAEYAKVLSVVV